ncbi:hypothetical protein HDU78_003827 [Chytriomyces hyalinus]|nr:hypothetical protein HDU78_003827 [Chytriomyces hyalinus]
MQVDLMVMKICEFLQRKYETIHVFSDCNRYRSQGVPCDVGSIVVDHDALLAEHVSLELLQALINDDTEAVLATRKLSELRESLLLRLCFVDNYYGVPRTAASFKPRAVNAMLATFRTCVKKLKLILGMDIEVLHKTVKTNKLNDMMCFVVHKDDKPVSQKTQDKYTF